MIDDPDYIKKRIAYVDTVRAIHKNKRLAGFVGCALGVVLMAWARFHEAAPQWEMWAGLTIIAVSWALFAFVMFERTRYVRSHPFDAES